MKFEIGDRVKVVKIGEFLECTNVKIGDEATIKGFDGVDPKIALEFDEPIEGGHDCCRLCKKLHGRWVDEDEIELIEIDSMTPEQYSFSELKQLILFWAKDKGILEKGTLEAQVKKTAEEVAELVLAVGQKNSGEIIDGIGDSMVTLVILADMYGWTPEYCLYQAYKEIQNRTGKMINGTFVKDKHQ